MLRLDDAELAIDTAGVATEGDTILPLILRYLVIFLFKFEFQFTLAVGVVGPVRVPTSNCVSSLLGYCSITYSLIIVTAPQTSLVSTLRPILKKACQKQQIFIA